MASDDARTTMNVSREHLRQIPGDRVEPNSGQPRNPFWKKMGDRFPFIDKESLADSGRQFLITNVRYVAIGKYGPQWFLTITVPNEYERDVEDQYTLTFPATEGRQQFFSALQQETDAGRAVPSVLVTFPTSQGDAYGLSEPANPQQTELPPF